MAMKAYMRIAAEERAWAWHLSMDRAEADYRNGLLLAKQKGGEERALSAARNMLARNYPVAEIAEITNLPPEEVEKLVAERV